MNSRLHRALSVFDRSDPYVAGLDPIASFERRNPAHESMLQREYYHKNKEDYERWDRKREQPNQKFANGINESGHGDQFPE